MEQQERRYNTHMKNQDLRGQSRDRLSKRKNERDIVRPSA